jgi:cysteine desulfurase / selenocysteine lyase
MLDLDRIRRDTPSCSQLIHFNNAGCALSPKIVTDATIAHLQLEQDIGGYEAAVKAENDILEFYSSLATLLNCQPDDIAFIENASRAWELALYSIPWQQGDQIITVENEYVSNYLGLLHLQHQQGVEIKLVPCREDGLVNLDKLESAITKKTKLIALTHIASQRGDIQPAAAVGTLAKSYDVLFLLDACQSVGQVQIDVDLIACDFLCGTGRKYLRGPRGTGFLYASPAVREITEPVFIDNHSAVWKQPNTYEIQASALRYETWERNIAGKIGLAKAIGYGNEIGMENIEAEVQRLGKELSEKLAAVNKVRVFELSTVRSGIVTFQKQGVYANELSTHLRNSMINTSVSKAVNAQLDLAKNHTGDINRASIHYYNTCEEIDRLVEAVDAL